MALIEAIKQRWVMLSSLQAKLLVTATVIACCIFGFAGLVAPCVVLYCVGTIGLDAETVLWFRKVHSTYFDETADESAADLGEGISIVPSRRTAVKFAIKAQSKLGMLEPTKANRMVYETTLLRLFEEHRVRNNVRISLLGEALVACYVRPKEYQYALDVIDHMGLEGSVNGLE